ncbi:MAG: hypothetical protein ABIG39_06945, partial [Candidatus Micrarchaeota archaeon]
MEANRKGRHETVNFILEFWEMYASLNSAVEKAGGIGIEFKTLQEMSALELMAHLCTNGIRFAYEAKDGVLEQRKKENENGKIS